MKFSVVIPTYNEVGTISRLLDEIQREFQSMPQHKWSVVVVDANSPDGTGDIVKEKQKQFSNIHLITETEKKGIAIAYITGIEYSFRKLNADAFIEFDGDGQHDPKDIVRLVHVMTENNYDCVIGSRYISGGYVPNDWSLYRRILSKFGSLFTQLLLEFPTRDFTSGLKVTRLHGPGELLPLSQEKLLTRNYAYKIQFLYELMIAGAHIEEIPITFRVRTNDVSKSSWKDIIDTLRVILILRFRTLNRWRFLRVVVIGGIGFLVQAVLFELIGIQWKLLTPGLTVILVAIAAIFTNFFLHEHFSFKDKRLNASPIIHRLARFFTLTLFGSILIQWVMVHGAGILTNNDPSALRIAYVLGVGLGLIVSYTGYYFWVWARSNRRSASALK